MDVEEVVAGETDDAVHNGRPNSLVREVDRIAGQSAERLLKAHALEVVPAPAVESRRNALFNVSRNRCLPR